MLSHVERKWCQVANLETALHFSSSNNESVNVLIIAAEVTSDSFTLKMEGQSNALWDTVFLVAYTAHLSFECVVKLFEYYLHTITSMYISEWLFLRFNFSLSHVICHMSCCFLLSFFISVFFFIQFVYFVTYFNSVSCQSSITNLLKPLVIFFSMTKNDFR